MPRKPGQLCRLDLQCNPVKDLCVRGRPRQEERTRRPRQTGSVPASRKWDSIQRAAVPANGAGCRRAKDVNESRIQMNEQGKHCRAGSLGISPAAKGDSSWRGRGWSRTGAFRHSWVGCPLMSFRPRVTRRVIHRISRTATKPVRRACNGHPV